MKEVKELMGLEKKYKVLKVEDAKEEKQIVKYIYIEKITKKERCPICNSYTKSIHDKLKPIKLKHVKAFEYTTYLIIEKRRFICHKCNKKFTEEVIVNEENKSISTKLEQKILKDLLEYNLTLKYIAKNNNISDMTVRNILLNAMKDYPEYVRLLPRVISFDEFKADTDRGKYAFILNDPIHKATLDILPTRKKDDLIQYFTKTENRSSVEFVISDMYEPYLLVTKIMFPKAKYIVDRFHYITYVMDALDDIRIRIQDEYGYNSKEYRLLKNKKNVSLLRKYRKDISWFVYTKRYKNKHMVEMLPGDILNEIFEINEEIKRGYDLKELFLDIVNHSTYEDSKSELLSWIDLCRESKIKEFINASNTIENWLEYIVNSFIDERFSNGFTEGLNNKIKVIKRNGFGYKNFEFFRLRLLYILRHKISGNSKKDGFQKNKKNKK